MASVVNLLSLLKSFSLHQNSVFVHSFDFADYMRRFAQKHISEHPELSVYLSQSQEVLSKEIHELADKKKVFLDTNSSEERIIVVPAFYGEKFGLKFNEIYNNTSIPYPLYSDLPKHFPLDVVQKMNANDFVFDLLDSKLEATQNVLYGIVFPRDLPIIIFPGSVTADILFNIALSKIRNMLRKEEYHDYFLKKLKISNPGKELTAKNFFTQFMTKGTDAIQVLKSSNESFYYWTQLCFFIRQDYEKVKDYTQEDIAIIQSVYLTEFAISFFKNKAQQDQQRAAALKVLEQALSKPPYYFSRDTINGFVDTRGIPLLGQYTQDDLSEYLHHETTTAEETELPKLLIFKTDNDQTFYIQKQKVLPLILRLSTDARDSIKPVITKRWYNAYKRFETLPEMNDQKEFEKRLEKETKVLSPILYALLNANFLSLIQYETMASTDSAVSKINLFANGTLLPYSELLFLKRTELLSDVKIILPLWYTVPIISWIAALFLKPSKRSAKKKKSKKVANPLETEETTETRPKKQSSKSELVNAAKSLEKALVPEGSTLERELAAYNHQWNRILNKSAAQDLTEDVNSLIRDYMRKTIKTLPGSNFTITRIQHLAETLAGTESLSRIKDKDQLIMYIELYILKLVKNL